MKVIGWHAWYADGSQYDSKDLTWCDLPDDGVVVIYLYKEGGYRESMCGFDHYFKAGNVYGFNNDSIKEIKKRYPGASVKKGKWVSHEDMERIQQDALEYGN